MQGGKLIEIAQKTRQQYKTWYIHSRGGRAKQIDIEKLTIVCIYSIIISLKMWYINYDKHNVSAKNNKCEWRSKKNTLTHRHELVKFLLTLNSIVPSSAYCYMEYSSIRDDWSMSSISGPSSGSIPLEHMHFNTYYRKKRGKWKIQYNISVSISIHLWVMCMVLWWYDDCLLANTKNHIQTVWLIKLINKIHCLLFHK